MNLGKLKEAFMGAKATPSTKIYKAGYYQEERPAISFKDYIKYFEQVPQIQNGLTSFVDLAIGTQININVEPGQEKAKELIEKWNNETKFFDKFRSVCLTTVICGVALMEYLNEKKIMDVAEVDMRSITGKQRDDFGKTEYYEQQITAGGTNKLDPKKFIEFEYQNVARAKWAIPPHHSLCIPRQVGNRIMPSVLDTMISTDDALTAIISNHAYPEEFIVFDGMADEELEKMKKLVEKRKPGEKWVVSRAPTFVVNETKGDSKYQGYIERMDKITEIGTQFPIEIQTGDFTSRASSDVTHTMLMQKVKAFQRNQGTKLKNDLYDIILLQNGFEPELVKLQVSFGATEVVELDIPQVISLRNSGVTTIKETREYLVQHTDFDAFDEVGLKADQEQKEKEDEEKQQAFAQRFQNRESKPKCKLCKEHQHALCTKKRCKCEHAEPAPTEEDLRRMRANLIEKLAKRDGIELS